jgi:ATP synthase protein I
MSSKTPPDFDERLARARERQRKREGPQTAKPQKSSMTGLGKGLRIAGDLVAGVFVGMVLGYALDRMAGTSPWGLIVLTIIGMAAGFWNIARVGFMPPDEKQ